MKKTSINLGTISMLIGVVLCAVKFSGAALATYPWYVVSAPLWGPFALWAGLMLIIWAIIWVRGGADAAADLMFSSNDNNEIEFTEEEAKLFKEWLDERTKKV